jgi:hypothetical protein
VWCAASQPHERLNIDYLRASVRRLAASNENGALDSLAGEAGGQNMISPLFLIWVLPVAILLGAAYGLLMTVVAILVYFSFVAVWLWHKAASAIRPTG